MHTSPQLLPSQAARSTTHVLVVGRDESVGALLANNLGVPGFEVQTAANGPEALTRIGERRPDLIVVDATSPSPNHWAFAGTGGAEDGSAHLNGTPIVALSTRDQLKEVVARPGVWVCLVKPVKAEVLAGAVTRIANFCSAPSG